MDLGSDFRGSHLSFQMNSIVHNAPFKQQTEEMNFGGQLAEFRIRDDEE